MTDQGYQIEEVENGHILTLDDGRRFVSHNKEGILKIIDNENNQN